VERRKPRVIVYEKAAAAAPVMERLAIERPDLTYLALTSPQIYAACGQIYQTILTRRLAHVGDPLLAAQWGQVAKVERDGAMRWARRRSAGFIDAVMAATMAIYAAAQGIAPEPEIQIFT
jgi:phage terminase large subunit-like protein